MNYSLKVNGRAAGIYEETVFPAPYNETKKMECAQFFIRDSAELEITSKIPVQSVIVRPLSSGIKAEITDGVIKIKLSKPQKFSVEINGSYEHNLAVFAERAESISYDGRNEIRFKNGEHKQDIFLVNKSNTVVYLEQDAVLKGKLLIKDCENVTVCGFGKITMVETDWSVKPVEKRRALEVISCRNVTVRDIRISDSVDWSLRVMGSDGVTVDNVKIIGCRGNSDGVDICGSRNVQVRNIFTRTWDDSFVLKALDTGDAENVTFSDSVLWNDFARPLEVGVELRADNVRNITFKNLDIIHSPTGYPLMGIHHGDRAKVRNITFEDIRIEDAPGAQLFDIRIADSVWNRDGRMGDIADVTFRNISYIGKPGMKYALSNSRIEGFSSEHSVKNVTLENISILGKTAGSEEELGLNITDFAEKVQFVCPKSCVRITPVMTKLTVTDDFVCGDDGIYRASLVAELYNPNDVQTKGRVWLQISPKNTAEYDGESYEYDIAPGGRELLHYDVQLQPGKYYFCLQSENADVRGDWFYKSLDLVLDNKPKTLKFCNYYGNEADVKLSVRDEALVIESDALKYAMAVYAAMPAEDIPGQVQFSVEETDFGEAPAVLLGRHGYETAPQLRCPAEITYVFKNEPKVKKITRLEICADSGRAVVPFEKMDVSGDNFWLEIEAKLPEVSGYRYPFTLFHSVKPENTAHMFADVLIKED